MTETWQQTVRQAAKKRAQREAKEKWHVSSKSQIPFDYRWEHIKAVVGIAHHLATRLDADEEIAEASAWLHDICKMEPRHGIAGAREAARLLATTDFPPEKIDAVSHAISRHVGLYRAEAAPPLTPLETAILWDADKLTKLGVQAVIYAMSAPYANGKSLSARRKDFVQFADETLCRTVFSMNTELGKEMAEKRFQEMMNLLDAWTREEHEGE